MGASNPNSVFMLAQRSKSSHPAHITCVGIVGWKYRVQGPKGLIFFIAIVLQPGTLWFSGLSLHSLTFSDDQLSIFLNLLAIGMWSSEKHLSI